MNGAIDDGVNVIDMSPRHVPMDPVQAVRLRLERDGVLLRPRAWREALAWLDCWQGKTVDFSAAAYAAFLLLRLVGRLHPRDAAAVLAVVAPEAEPAGPPDVADWVEQGRAAGTSAGKYDPDWY